jgi:hypothetical protein
VAEKKKGPKVAAKVSAAPPATPGRDRAATPQVEEVTPPPGPGHFPRLQGESEAEHRGFLLWAMQTPGARSYRLTAKAAKVTDTSVRRWAERRSWSSRVEGLTRSDGLAWRAWLAHYADSTGIAGISIVQPNMVIEGPLTPLAYLRQRLGDRADPSSYEKESTARSILDAAADASMAAMGDDPEEGEDPGLGPNPLGGSGGAGEGANPLGGKDVEGAQRPHPAPATPAGSGATPPATPATHRDEAMDPGGRKKRVSEFRALVGATLNIYGQDVKHTLDPQKFPKGQTIRVTPKDVPLLIELAHTLAEVPESTAAVGPMESVRVRIARERGEDVLEALGHDHEEMGVVLSSLATKKAQEAEHLRQELARARGAEVIPLREEAG